MLIEVGRVKCVRRVHVSSAEPSIADGSVSTRTRAAEVLSYFMHHRIIAVVAVAERRMVMRIDSVPPKIMIDRCHSVAAYITL